MATNNSTSPSKVSSKIESADVLRWIIIVQFANVWHPSLDVVVLVPHKKHLVGEVDQV
jgi:hypothetical protein